MRKKERKKEKKKAMNEESIPFTSKFHAPDGPDQASNIQVEASKTTAGLCSHREMSS
jgi:hypothetical protein